MKIESVTKEDNKLLRRTEVKAVFDCFGEATPKRNDIRKQLAAKLGSESDLLVIKRILMAGHKAICKANLYGNKDDIKLVESPYVMKRLEAKAVKKEETPAEAPKAEEKPVEEKPAEVAAPEAEKKEGE
jgi:ribosomal protein S24E